MAAGCSSLVASPARAAYPERPIKLIVPFPPGGIVDGIGRAAADGMAKVLGQVIVVENRAGAAGKIAAEAAAGSAPDGYTLFLANGTSHGTLPVADPNFDPNRLFAPVGVIATTPFVLAGNVTLQAGNYAELIALAKSKPGMLAYATPGIGSASHFAGELLKYQAKIDLLHVPYRGLAPALQDVMGGQAHLTFDSTVLPLLRTGRLKAFAVTSKQRWTQLPDLPTLVELGLADFDIVGWAGLAVPAKTPPEIIGQLNDALNRALALPDVQERMKTAGLTPAGGDARVMAQLTTDSIARYARIARDTRMKFE